MTNLLLLLAATAAAGPLKIDGAKLASTDLVTTGTVSVADTGVTLGGGRLTLTEARQKALDTQLNGKPLTFMVTVVDNTSADTTAFTFGTVRLLAKDKGWYLVNTPGNEWHQVALGTVSKGTPLKIAIVAQDGTAHVLNDGKEVGTMPFKPAEKQPLAFGSPAGEPNPFKGEVRDFDLVAQALKAEEIAKRFAPAAGAPTPPVAATKSTTVQVELVNLTEVPDPQSILPYKSALITHEYKVISVQDGSIEGIAPNAIIRVARWGIVSSKKTDLANAKKGDKLTLRLERFKDHPSLEHQYTVDTLPSNYVAPYVLDVTAAPGG